MTPGKRSCRPLKYFQFVAFHIDLYERHVVETECVESCNSCAPQDVRGRAREVIWAEARPPGQGSAVNDRNEERDFGCGRREALRDESDITSVVTLEIGKEIGVDFEGDDTWAEFRKEVRVMAVVCAHVNRQAPARTKAIEMAQFWLFMASQSCEPEFNRKAAAGRQEAEESVTSTGSERIERRTTHKRSVLSLGERKADAKDRSAPFQSASIGAEMPECLGAEFRARSTAWSR